MLKQYDEVDLVNDLMSDDLIGKPILLKAGQKGQIMEIYDSPKGFDVEFFDKSGKTVAVMIVKEKNLKFVQKGLTETSREVA